MRAIVQHPLNSVMALESSGISRPSQLAGKKIGYPGIPTNEPLLDTMLKADGVAVRLGASDWRILTSHILPATMSYVAVAGTLGLASAILIEAALNFLGLGVQIPTPTWGNMMTAAQSIHVIVYPRHPERAVALDTSRACYRADRACRQLRRRRHT